MIEAMIHRYFPENLTDFLNRNPVREFLSWSEQWMPDGTRLSVKNIKTGDAFVCFVYHCQ